MKVIKTDVVVVGGGGAALRAALEANSSGSKVLIVQKGIGSTAYKVAETAGFNVPDGVVDSSDNPQAFLEDILDAALGTCDENLAKILSEEANLEIRYLEENGVYFEQDNNKYLEVTGCFARKPRMHIIKGHGEPIIKALKEKVKQTNIEILEDIMVTKIITKEGRVRGVFSIDMKKEEYLLIECIAVVLGTGGAGQLFKFNHNPPDVTGDGYALAFNAGAQLVNMEFMQSGLGIIKPLKVNFNNWIWAGCPKILNKDKEEFIESYLTQTIRITDVMNDKSKHYPFSSRDNSRFIEEGIHKEIIKGRGTDNMGVYVDFSPLLNMPFEEMPEHMAKLWPITRSYWVEHDVDLEKDKVEISTFGHAINGGVRINEDGASTMLGLFAAGETAGGPHGADRLGGNMLVTCQVFGRRAGKAAAYYTHQHNSFNDEIDAEVNEETNRLNSYMNRNSTESIQKIRKDISNLMWKNYLVVKNKKSLKQIIDNFIIMEAKLDKCKIETFTDLRSYLEVVNMILVARIMVKSADYRKESRGSHYRDDYPYQVADYEKPIFVVKDADEIQVEMGNF